MADSKHLIQRAQQGDRQAVAALYDQFHAPVFRYIAYRVGEAALAEDLAAEVFVLMIRKLHTFKDHGRPFLAWLYTIAGNVVKMHYRRQKTAQMEPLSEELIDRRASPENKTHTRLTQARLMLALPHLTETQREVILLKFIEGLSNGEIARILNRSEGSVKSLQHRALNALRRILAEEVLYEPS